MTRADNDAMDNWRALGADWRGQPMREVDVASLLADVRRRDRRMQAARALDAALLLLALLACGYALVQAWADVLEMALYAGLMLVCVALVGWVHWLRRGQWRAADLRPAGLLAFEQARSRTSLRIWRGSVWLGCLLWCALTVPGILLLQRGDANTGQAREIALNIAVNALVLLASAVLAAWLGRRARIRLRRLAALQKRLHED